MAKLFFKYGTMKSGKSTHLLMTAHNYESQGKNVLVLTSSLDDRWGEGRVTSRLSIYRSAVEVSDFVFNTVRYQNERTPLSCVLVDESQFLSEYQIVELARVVDELGIPVICYGLKNDFANNLFTGSQALLVYADEIELIKTVCEHEGCGKRAIMNVRLVDNKPVYSGEQVMIGDEEYVPVCRNHYFNY